MVRPVRERVHKARSLHTKHVPLAVTYSQVKRCGCKRLGFMICLAGTEVGISLCIVAKMLVGINALASSLTSDRVPQQLHVGSDPGFLTANQVADAAVTRIRNHSSHCLIDSIFMSFNEPQQLRGFVDRTGGGLYGGDDLMGIVDHSMSLIA